MKTKDYVYLILFYENQEFLNLVPRKKDAIDYLEKATFASGHVGDYLLKQYELTSPFYGMDKEYWLVKTEHWRDGIMIEEWK